MRRALLLLALTACGSPPPPEPLRWQQVFDGLPGAVLRIWGTAHDDVYAVGSDGDDRGEPLFLHYDGSRWKRIATGLAGIDLWWVDRVGDDALRIVGEGGTVLRYRPTSGALERRTAPNAATLFGVWGKAENDVWYVGGDIDTQLGAVWRDNGEAIAASAATVTGTAGAVLFKVYGFDDGVWVVGQRGLTAFFDGTRFESHPIGVSLPLFTVHGVRKDRVYAVGGVADGVVARWDGTAWTNETPAGTPQLNGVFALSDDEAYAAGFNGRIFHRTAASGWAELTEELPTFKDLHTIWVDETGGIWAGGGQLGSRPPKDGVLIHYGQPVSSEIAP